MTIFAFGQQMHFSTVCCQSSNNLHLRLVRRRRTVQKALVYDDRVDVKLEESA